MKYETKEQRLEVYTILKELFQHIVDKCTEDDDYPDPWLFTPLSKKIVHGIDNDHFYDSDGRIFLSCLCHGVVLVTNDKAAYNLEYNFPELYKQCPDKKLAYWFNTNKKGHMKRIECLDEAIKLCN